MGILLTGNSGRLGTELNRLISGLLTPGHKDLDVIDEKAVKVFFSTNKLDLIVHAAAYTNVADAELQKENCWAVNVEGTRNLVKAALEYAIPFIHISTDYVFYGDTGMYKEEDPLGPVRNYYALTKLVAESLVRLVPEHLVIRTSFRPREWPYDSAFEDLYTSQDYVDVIAPDIALAIKHFAEIPFQTLHIATERKSVFDLARRRKPDVKPGSKKNVSVDLPDDISLDTSRWQTLKQTFKGNL